MSGRARQTCAWVWLSGQVPDGYRFKHLKFATPAQTPLRDFVLPSAAPKDSPPDPRGGLSPSQALCAEGGRLTRASHLETANGCPETQSATREPSWNGKAALGATPAGPRLLQPASLNGLSWGWSGGRSKPKMLETQVPPYGHRAAKPNVRFA